MDWAAHSAACPFFVKLSRRLKYYRVVSVGFRYRGRPTFVSRRELYDGSQTKTIQIVVIHALYRVRPSESTSLSHLGTLPTIGHCQ